MVSPAADLNAHELTLRFVARLLTERPLSILDVGAGSGLVLGRCHRTGIPVVGLEIDPDQARELSARGFPAAAGDAEALPFADRSFDWVIMRHVPHHLADPGRAFAEADRVARSGLLIAEPWYDVTLPCQELGCRIEAWRKRQHRRAGRIHNPNLTPGEILALLPHGAFTDVRIEAALALRRIPPEELEPLLNIEVAGLTRDDPDRDELILLRRELRQRGASFNGTQMLILRRRAKTDGRDARAAASPRTDVELGSVT